MMTILSNPSSFPLEYLKGRIAFRKAWAFGEGPASTFDWRDRQFELRYDELHNFARMGAEFVDDSFGVVRLSKKQTSALQRQQRLDAVRKKQEANRRVVLLRNKNRTNEELTGA